MLLATSERLLPVWAILCPLTGSLFLPAYLLAFHHFKVLPRAKLGYKFFEPSNLLGRVLGFGSESSESLSTSEPALRLENAIASLRRPLTSSVSRVCLRNTGPSPIGGYG